MKNLVSVIVFCLGMSITALSQEVEVIKYGQLEKIIAKDSDKVKVINFWATWCKPCIEELPYFEQINKDYGKDKVEVILVSLDFREDLNTKVKKFVNFKKLASKIYLLDETDFNEVIDKINPEWTGAIPATLIVDRQQSRSFYEKQFKAGELESIILEHIN